MQFRFAQPDEIPAVARLVAHSFIGRTADHWAEQLRDPPHGGGVETVLLAHAGGRPAAALQLHPLRQWIGGHALPIAGIGTVTVSPTHRQQGLAGKLMERALHEALARGDVASALYPFRNTFYQKLGYGLAGEALQYMVPPASLPAAVRDSVELLDTDSALNAALLLYNEWIRTQTGQIERTSSSWAHLHTAADTAVIGYRNSGGHLEGYALITYPADLPSEKRYLDVNEMVWLSAAARHALFGWLASLGDQWQRILLRGLRSHHLADVISEPRVPSGMLPGWGLWRPAGMLMLGPMFRLLDLPRAWAARSTLVNEPLPVTLELVDAQIPENSGEWTLRLEREGCSMERGASTDGRLRMNISTLSRIFIGALRPSAAHEAGLLECDRLERLPRLDAALMLPEPWMFDRF